jgi:hypothetical protein
MKIHSSNNYTLFVANPKQRKFVSAHVKKIMRKMKANGFTPSMAISVFKRSDGKLVINTGHHRLAAAKELGIPALYIIEHEWTSKELVDEGTTGKNWGCAAAAETYAKEGNKDYITLLGYTNRGIPMRYAASMLRGEHAASGNSGQFVNDGTFKVKTTAHINEVLGVVDALKDRADEATSMTFISAISALTRVVGFSSSTLIRKIGIMGGRIEKAKTRDQMLDYLEEIYNYQNRSKEPLAFLAKEALRLSNATFGRSSK